MKAKLQTRDELINQWLYKCDIMDGISLNDILCPHCYHTLTKSDYIENMYYCNNQYCFVKEVVNLK